MTKKRHTNRRQSGDPSRRTGKSAKFAGTQRHDHVCASCDEHEHECARCGEQVYIIWTPGLHEAGREWTHISQHGFARAADHVPAVVARQAKVAENWAASSVEAPRALDGDRSCGVCAEPLAEMIGPEGRGLGLYAHRAEVAGGVVDHPTIPVRLEEVRRTLKCDFCSARDPQWRVPVSDFVMAETGKVVETSTGDWTACADCAEHIRRDDWAGLAWRGVAGVADTAAIGTFDSRSMFAWVSVLYERVRANKQGDLTLDTILGD